MAMKLYGDPPSFASGVSFESPIIDPEEVVGCMVMLDPEAWRRENPFFTAVREHHRKMLEKHGAIWVITAIRESGMVVIKSISTGAERTALINYLHLKRNRPNGRYATDD